MTDNPWSDVKPLTPTEGTYEVAFLFLDMGSGADIQTVSARIADILNGVYLRGWQDSNKHSLGIVQAFIDAKGQDS